MKQHINNCHNNTNRNVDNFIFDKEKETNEKHFLSKSIKQGMILVDEKLHFSEYCVLGIVLVLSKYEQVIQNNNKECKMTKEKESYSKQRIECDKILESFNVL